MLRRAYPDWSPAELEQLQRESWLRPYAYEPFTQFREGPLRGRFVNVDAAGFRWSSPQCAWPPPPSTASVFVFGGSTTFGYGLADADTVPSRLQELLRARDASACVYNFGRGFFYSSQEAVLFERLLVAGFVPRAALFVDGLNDLLHEHDAPKFTEQLARHVAEINAHLEDPSRRAASRLAAGPLVPAYRPGGTALAQPAGSPAAAVERYERNRRVAAAAGAAFGVRTVFAWHPVPVRGCSIEEHPFAERVREAAWAGAVREGYDLVDARRRAGHADGLVWCADVVSASEPCDYVDAVHYGPSLSRRVAECLAQGLAAAPAGERGPATPSAAAP